MSNYQYHPLEIGHIRLVKLLPGEHHETIRISIETVELRPISDTPKSVPPRMNARSLESTLPPNWSAFDTLDDEILFYYEISEGTIWEASWDHPKSSVDPLLYRKPALPTRDGNDTCYEALSYTWRSIEPEEDVLVEIESDNVLRTFSLRLSGNSACAMRHLRYPQKCRRLWIDAVCIDQSNLDEREEQVARMSSIYQNASRVVVWLGNGSEESDLAMCKLAYLGRQVILTRDNWLITSPGAEEPYWYENGCDVPYSEETWSAIGNLLGRSWFSRIWIIQEIQLAAHGAVVQCGREHMSWSHFRSAITCLWNKKALPRPLSRGRLRFIKDLSWTYYKHTAVSELLHLIRGRECFDERDYVFGVLGLLPPEFRSAITPNYKLTAAEVFTNLTISYLKEQKDLNILRDCQIGENRRHGLPSWVPDLSNTKQWSQPLDWQNAASSLSAVFQIMDSGNLEVTGLTCATVGFAEELDHNHTDTRGNNILQLLGFQDTIPGNVCSEMDGVMLERFCNTLAGGYLRDRHPNEVLPSLQTWKTEVTNPQYLQKLIDRNTQEESLLSFYDQWVFDILQKKVFFKTCKGSIGLGPQGLREGDSIVVLLGCDSPLILRPAPNMRYVIIGECYLDELKDAAALLGPLLPNWQVQVYTQSVYRRGNYRFLDRDTGKIQDEDPRMSESTRNLGVGEELSGNDNMGSPATKGLASSRTGTYPNQGHETGILEKSIPSLQKFVLC